MTPAISNYIDHRVHGKSMRDIARREGVEASTVSRRIDSVRAQTQNCPLTAYALSDPKRAAVGISESEMGRHSKTPLRRLTERGSVLVASPGMTAIVARMSDGKRLTTLPFDVACAMAVFGWIEPTASIANGHLYHITTAGRGALSTMLNAKTQGERSLISQPPLTVLSKRLDAHGKPILSEYAFDAGLKLREMYDKGLPEVETFLTYLGSDQAEAVRMFLFREIGVVTIEKRLGWSNRSAKHIIAGALTVIAKQMERMAEHA